MTAAPTERLPALDAVRGFTLLLAATLAPALITYELLVRLVGWLLNGRRRPWPAKPQLPVQAQTQVQTQEGIA